MERSSMKKEKDSKSKKDKDQKKLRFAEHVGYQLR